MFRKPLLIAVVAAACGGTAASAEAMTVSVGAPSLITRAAVAVPVTVSCSPFDPSLTLVGEGVTVDVEQASGRSIASATGSINTFIGAIPLPFACDGGQSTVPITATANTAGAPFHGGPAVVSASAYAQAGLPCLFGGTECWEIIANQPGAVGATKVNLH